MKQRAGSKREQTFLQGALILTLSMAIVKVIGALFKIPLAKYLGGEGYGYFLTAYNLYNPIFTLASAGFPIAISRMISESLARKRFRDVRQVHRVSIPIFLTTGGVGFLLMFGGAFIYVKVIDAPGAIYSMLALSPTILFACLMSIYRGYYQGMSNMVPTAISEVIEALCKLLLGLGFCIGIIKLGMNEYYASGTVFGVPYQTEELAHSAILPFASAGAILGITVGSVAGFLFLLVRHRLRGDGFTREEFTQSPPARSARNTLRSLIRIAVPVGIGALILNLAGFVDATLIQRRLKSVMDSSSAVLLNIYKGLIPQESIAKGAVHTYLYGCYGYAGNIMMIIPAITQTFGISALPAVTVAWTNGIHNELKKSIESVLRVSALFTIPAGLGIAFLSNPILNLLYGDSPAEVAIASPVLVVMGFGAIFSAISTPLCSMLQAIGRVDLPVKLLTIGLAIKILLNYTLVGIPDVNIQGASAGTLICYAFVTVASLFFLCRETKVLPNFVSVFLKPLLAGLLCAIAAYATQGLFALVASQTIATVAAICFAVVVYVVALVAFRAINKDDVLMLPKGSKILKLLEKRNWIG